MGPPLSIINEFIYMNIIKPILKRESRLESESLSEKYYDYTVIPKDELKKFLKQNIPENINNKMMATWEERI